MAFDASPSEIPGLKPEFEFLSPKERLVILRNFLAKLPENKFEMSTWLHTEHSCGTVACIGGWTAYIFYTDTIQEDYPERAIGLTEEESDRLFLMCRTEKSYDDVTLPIAIAHLDQIIATGEISWDKVFASLEG